MQDQCVARDDPGTTAIGGTGKGVLVLVHPEKRQRAKSEARSCGSRAANALPIGCDHRYQNSIGIRIENGRGDYVSLASDWCDRCLPSTGCTEPRGSLVRVESHNQSPVLASLLHL